MKVSVACPYCNKTPKDQHSLREGGICDGLRSGKIRKVGDRLLQTHDGAEVVSRRRTKRRVKAVVEPATKAKKK